MVVAGVGTDEGEVSSGSMTVGFRASLFHLSSLGPSMGAEYFLCGMLSSKIR